MELHATEFERFMYKTKGVGDHKSELWLKDRGELAKYRDGDCRWPKTLRTAWKKRGYDSHRDAAVTMVPYCPNPKCKRRIKAVSAAVSGGDALHARSADPL